MATNLLESVRNFMNPDLVDRASAHLGESRDGIEKAVSGGIPAVLASFISRAEGGDAEGLLRDSREAATHNLAQTAGTMFSADREDHPVGPGLGNLFSGGLSSIPAAIASFAGIKPGSANSLLSLLAPLGLGVIGRHAMDNNLDAEGLRSFLTSQKSTVINALPPELNIGSLFGATGHAQAPTGQVHSVSEAMQARTAARTPHMEPERRRAAASSTWPLWVLLGIGAIALLWYLLSRGDHQNEVATGTATTDTAPVATSPVTTTTTSAHAAKAPTKVRLANGTELNAYAGGVEEKLVNCLNDASCRAGNDQWFDFDNINFETGSAKLTAESQTQVQNIATVLNAYPNARIKIGGYTDKVGNEASNKRLSQQRADAVLSALKAAGARPEQLVGAEGYGSQFARVPAEASDAERRADRRIAVQLREK